MSGEPYRSGAPAGVFAYGCPPIDDSPADKVREFLTPKCHLHGLPLPCPTCTNTVNPLFPFVQTQAPTLLSPCGECGKHYRAGEGPCPWCLRADLDALKRGASPSDRDELIVKLDSVGVANESLRAALRKALARLREFERAAGVPLPELGEIEAALGEVPR